MACRQVPGSCSKAGTSLSKGFGLIRRFSEDIDVTVFRNDLGEGYSVEQLEAMSGKKRQAALDAIRAACEAHISGPLLEQLSRVAAGASQRNAIKDGRLRVELDKEDSQTLLLTYPIGNPPQKR